MSTLPISIVRKQGEFLIKMAYAYLFKELHHVEPRLSLLHGFLHAAGRG
ncbi:MAG: hypothetical protein RLZZ237_2008 [Pseudomonadota bacterium]|jgi:hypothetical protein